MATKVISNYRNITSNQNIVQFIMKSKTLDQESIFGGVGRNFASKCLPIGKHD